jgi:hypothetical protein
MNLIRIGDKQAYTQIKINTNSILEIGHEPVEFFDRFKNIKHSTVRPKAFKFRQFSKAIQSISENKNEKTNKELIEKRGTILSEILVGDTQFDETETSIELNFALLKLKHIVKRKK